MAGLHNKCHSSLKDYEIVAEIFTDNGLEVQYFYENNNKSGDGVVSGMQVETENIEIEDASLAAGWPPPVDPELIKEDECSDTDI
jgi:hypothetical protein